MSCFNCTVQDGSGVYIMSRTGAMISIVVVLIGFCMVGVVYMSVVRKEKSNSVTVKAVNENDSQEFSAESAVDKIPEARETDPIASEVDPNPFHVNVSKKNTLGGGDALSERLIDDENNIVSGDFVSDASQ